MLPRRALVVITLATLTTTGVATVATAIGQSPSSASTSSDASTSTPTTVDDEDCTPDQIAALVRAGALPVVVVDGLSVVVVDDDLCDRDGRDDRDDEDDCLDDATSTSVSNSVSNSASVPGNTVDDDDCEEDNSGPGNADDDRDDENNSGPGNADDRDDDDDTSTSGPATSTATSTASDRRPRCAGGITTRHLNDRADNSRTGPNNSSRPAVGDCVEGLNGDRGRRRRSRRHGRPH
jgi:hypothetical protein